MKGLESDDPFELVRVIRPNVDEATDRETARCLVEEYMLAGFSAAEILELFASPMYAMPHAIQTRRGSEFVSDVVTGVFGGTG